MKIPADSPLPIEKGQRISEDVPNDGLLNEKSPLIPAELEILKESQQKMDDLSRSDWENLSQYRKKYNQKQQAEQALAMLEVQKDDPSYGFRVNNYRHCLQSATTEGRNTGGLVMPLRIAQKPSPRTGPPPPRGPTGRPGRPVAHRP